MRPKRPFRRCPPPQRVSSRRSSTPNPCTYVKWLLTRLLFFRKYFTFSFWRYRNILAEVLQCIVIVTYAIGVAYLVLVIIIQVPRLMPSRNDLPAGQEIHKWVKNVTFHNPYIFFQEPRNAVQKYPLELENASDLVRAVREGHLPAEVAPGIHKINDNYMNMQFAEAAMSSCEQNVTYGLLILIKTNTRHRKRRMGYRHMWANRTYLAKLEVPVIYAFLIGHDPDGGQNQFKLQREIETYQDFIIGDFLDTYWNLTCKSMMGIRWAVERCSHFRYYLAVDDDIYLSVEKVLQFLRNPYRYPDLTGFPVAKDLWTQDFYAGKGIYSIKYAFKQETSRYYLTEDEYPIKSAPNYVAGFFTLLSWTTVQNFYHLSPYIQALRIDDLYMGIMAEKLGIGLTFMNELLPELKDITELSMQKDSGTEDIEAEANATALCDRAVAVLKLLPYESGQEFLRKYGHRQVQGNIWTANNASL